MILCADVGGTNCRFALVKRNQNGCEREVLKSATESAQGAESFISLVNGFLEGVTEKPSWFVIAIAGVVKEHAEVRITNIPHWPVVKASEVAESSGIPNVSIINDFEANGYGIHLLNDEDVIQIGGGEKNPAGVKGVIGAGTGLGEAYCYPIEGTSFYQVVPSEGGHTEFAGKSLEDFEI